MGWWANKWSRIKEFVRDRRTHLAFIYCGAFFVLGIILAGLGPSLPDLATQTNSTSQVQSFMFSARAMGYLIGSVVGGILVDKFPGNRVLLVALLVCGICSATLPFATAVWIEALCILPAGLGMGVLDTSGNVLLIYLYGVGVEPYMQSLHFAFALGGFLSPLLIRLSHDRLGSIWPAWWLFALLSLPWIISVAFYDSPKDPSRKNGQTGTKYDLHAKLIILGTAIYLGVYVGAEVGAGGLLTTYVLQREIADIETAYVLPSAFWGAVALWRLLAIPISLFLTPGKMQMINSVGSIIGALILVIWSDSLVAMWVGAIIFGSAMASCFPTAITLAESYINVTGKAASVFVVGASLGELVLPAAFGALMTGTSPLAFPYGIFSCSIVMGLVVILLILKGSSRTKAPRIATTNGNGELEPNAVEMSEHVQNDAMEDTEVSLDTEN